MVRRAWRCTVLAFVFALAMSGVWAAEDTIDFEGLGKGEILSQVFGAGGTGPIDVYGFNPNCGIELNAAVVFDSATPDSDDDLGSPNETCDPAGPGVGIAGEVGQPTENCVFRGNTLIIHEHCDDLVGGGPVEMPDDADLLDAYYTFDFSAVAPVTINSILLMDVEAEEPNATVLLYDETDALIATIVLDPTGDNGVRVEPLGPAGVWKMEVDLNGSGAIDNIVFTTEDEPECGDGEVNAPGETCDPPGVPEGEPNECRDDCTFCGDGVLDPGEECDDGNNMPGDGCDAYCMDEPFCGDGEVNAPGETCDPPGEPAGEPNECREDCTFCGDGVLDPGEECDDGNNLPGDGCDAYCMIEMMGEGCTPGYWRQDQHFDSWMGYSPMDSFDAVFGVDATGDDTLLDAVWARGGGEDAMKRHAVAALLNAANPDVAYAYSTAEVIALVQSAYVSGDFEGVKDMLEAENGDDTYCPLN